MIVQYGIFLRNLFTEFNWGFCTTVGTFLQPVEEYLASKIPATLYVNVLSLIVSVPLGVIFGVIAAVFKNKWYRYQNGKDACFLFGADEYGYDICVRLASGARLSLTVSVLAAIINLVLGIIIGALEGYYGGTFDLVMERVKGILYQIPSLVFMTLFQIYFARRMGSMFAMFICFIFFGWISTSATVRAQFYRFKGQEYVMAARTLGAKDGRLIFRHILPNSSGFIITACVLSIPHTIFSEATYSYLGIVNLNSKTTTSLGSMLQNGQQTLSTYPHCVFFPALFLGLMLICFNIFGNGLRDAFNPSLRGADE